MVARPDKTATAALEFGLVVADMDLAPRFNRDNLAEIVQACEQAGVTFRPPPAADLRPALESSTTTASRSRPCSIPRATRWNSSKAASGALPRTDRRP